MCFQIVRNYIEKKFILKKGANNDATKWFSQSQLHNNTPVKAKQTCDNK